MRFFPMATYTYKGPTVRIPYPDASTLLRLKEGEDYEFPIGALPGLMDHHRPVASGRLFLKEEPAPAALPSSPKPAASTSKATKPVLADAKAEPKVDAKASADK
jgi:hypothetical protein